MKIKLEEAQNLLIDYARPREVESLELEQAVGRVSAQDFSATENLPADVRSAVDGFALSPHPDGSYERLYISKYYGMAEAPDTPLLPGQAAGVATGGLLPPGSVAVVPHERTESQGDYLWPQETIKPGQNFKAAGEDFKKGETLLTPGTIITPGRIALLAAFGQERIQVYRRPRVALLTLAPNAVCAYSEPLRPGKIRDTNTPMLQALLQLDGVRASAIYMGDGRNTQELAQEALTLLNTADMLLTTGGTYNSEGESEFQAIMKLIGATTLLGEVDIQPGSHNVVATLDSKIIVNLSGNPAACAVGYHLLVWPVLRTMQALKPWLPRVSAICGSSFEKKIGSRRFIRARVTQENSVYTATILPGQKPSMIRSLLDYNALIDLPAGHPPLAPGSEVQALLLDRAEYK